MVRSQPRIAGSMGLAVLLLPACVPDLIIADGSRISCTTDGDCPSDFVCDTVLTRCVGTGPVALEAPTAVVQSAGAATGRSLAEVPFRVAVNDVNGPPRGTEMVRLRVEFSVGDGELASATPSGSFAGITPDGSVATYHWNALADALAGTGGIGGLSAIGADTDGDGVADTDRLGGAWEVRLRITPMDSADLEGPSVLSDVFALGNDPPVVSVEPLEPVDGGDVTLVFTLSDPQGDPARLEVEFMSGTAAAWSEQWLAAAPIGDFLTTGLRTGPEGATHVFVWDSRAEPVPGDPAAPQGAGAVSLERVRFRLRAVDLPGGDGEQHYGPWTETPDAMRLANQSPPGIENLRAPILETRHGSGAVALHYRAVDAESDLVDVDFRYSLDGGRSWRRCEEYRSPLSEGRYDLASAPAAAGGGGVDHVFVWDTSGIAWSQASSASLSARIADDDATHVAAPIPLLHPAGPVGAIRAPIARSCAGLDVAECTGACTWNAAESLCQPDGLAGPSAVDAVTADLDGDGHVDLAYVEGTGGGLGVLRGDGAGGLVADGGEPLTAGGYDVLAAHLDGDDAIDLVVRGTGTVSVLLNDGNGALLPAVDYAALSTNSFAVGDLTGDGVLDLVVAGSGALGEGRLGVLAGSGTGTFDDVMWYLAGNGGGAVAVGDFDADGDDDAAKADLFGVVLLRHDGAGDLELSGPTLDVDGPFGAALAADLDGDGACDFAALNLGTDRVVVWHGVTDRADAGGAFGPAVDYRIALSGLSGGSLRADDLNGDGIADLVVTAPVPVATVSILWGGGDGTFSADAPFVVEGLQRAALGDLDGDGAAEIIASLDRDDFSVLAPSGLAVMRAAVTDIATSALFAPSRAFEGSLGPWGMAAADLDADGILDLAIANGGFVLEGEVSVALGGGQRGVGDGTFADPTGYGVGFEPRAVAVADFDGDALLDLAVANYVTDEICILAGRGYGGAGDGTFAAAECTDVGAGPSGIVAGRVDDDAVPDLVFVSEGASTLAVWLGNGDGTFDRRPPVSTGQSPRDVQIADLDADGVIDAVAVTEGGASIFSGDGAGDLVANGSIALSTGLTNVGRGLVLGDFDVDGALDLAVGMSSHVEVMLGDGAGGFGAPSSYASGVLARRFAVADLDEDGAPELIVGTFLGGEVVVLRNSGSGTFAAPVTVATGLQPGALVLADFDRDGLPDVAAADLEADQILVLGGQRGVARSWVTPLDGVIAATSGWSPDEGALDRFGALRRTPHLSRRRERAEAPIPPLGFRPLSAAWRFDGDVRLRRLGAGGLRLTSELALDLDAGRGVVLAVPLERCPDGDGDGTCDELAAGAEVRVTLRTGDWMRASELDCPAPADVTEGDACDPAAPPIGCDPLADEPQAPLSLPRRPRCVDGVVRFEDVIVERALEVDVPADADGDLSTGSGERYVIDGATLRVLTDRLGVLQAWVAR